MQSNFLTPEFVTDGQEAVDGVYPLGALLGRSAGGVVYETTYGEGEEARPATIKVARGDLPDAAEMLERWRGAMSFSHPNLSRIYAAGQSVLNDAPIVFVVQERAEESLAEVLAQRRLSEEEVREMLTPTLSAIAYLHGRGYAHGRVKPSNVLAAGETVKLSSDSISVADEGAQADDVYAIGRLIQQSIAREPGLAGAPALMKIVDNALDDDETRRWTVPQIQARLHGPVAVERQTPATQQQRRFPVWILAGLAALILVVAGLAILRKKEPAPVIVPPSEPAIARTTTPRPVAPAQAKPLAPKPRPVTPSSVTPLFATRPSATPRVSEAHGRRATGWAVIVAAYGTQAPAEKRKQALESKWPAFQWSVLQQKADKSYSLVVIGRNLSEDDAEALRKRALAAGLPRDVYIKRVP